MHAFRAVTCVVIGSLGVLHSAASDIGQLIASQVDQVAYRHSLDDRLFAHDGDSRGRFGAEHDPARQNIADDLAALGLSVELESFVYGGTEYFNVVATQVGFRYPDAQYVVGAHYDSVHNPGADDNASGVAGVLELARVLSGYRTEYTIKYIAFDLEELGLIGSYAYVDEHVADDIRGMISLDMIAYDTGGNTCLIFGGSASNPLIADVAAAAVEYGGLAPTPAGSFCASDHCPFEYAGFQACLLIEGDVFNNLNYHTPQDSVDTPGYIDYAFAADMVRTVAGLLSDRVVVRFTGDMNCDGSINGFDVEPFVLALSDPAGYAVLHPTCSIELGDTNGDGSTNGFDIDGFVALLQG